MGPDGCPYLFQGSGSVKRVPGHYWAEYRYLSQHIRQLCRFLGSCQSFGHGDGVGVGHQASVWVRPGFLLPRSWQLVAIGLVEVITQAPAPGLEGFWGFFMCENPGHLLCCAMCPCAAGYIISWPLVCQELLKRCCGFCISSCRHTN